MPVGVGEDGVACDFVEGNILCREAGCCGQRDTVLDPIGKIDRPLQGLHTAQAPAHDSGPARNTQVFGQPLLTANPILDLGLWKLTAPGLPGVRVDRIGA